MVCLPFKEPFFRLKIKDDLQNTVLSQEGNILGIKTWLHCGTDLAI